MLPDRHPVVSLQDSRRVLQERRQLLRQHPHPLQLSPHRLQQSLRRHLLLPRHLLQHLHPLRLQQHQLRHLHRFRRLHLHLRPHRSSRWIQEDGYRIPVWSIPIRYRDTKSTIRRSTANVSIAITNSITIHMTLATGHGISTDSYIARAARSR